MNREKKLWLIGFLSRCLHPGRYLERRYNIKPDQDYDAYKLFDKKRNPISYEMVHKKDMGFLIKPIRGSGGRYRINIRGILSRRKNNPVKKIYLQIREERKQHEPKFRL